MLFVVRIDIAVPTLTEHTSNVYLILIKEKSTTAKIAETGEHVSVYLKTCLHFTHSPVSETSPSYRVKIFTIK
jgi:hypothetical protein